MLVRTGNCHILPADIYAPASTANSPCDKVSGAHGVIRLLQCKQKKPGAAGISASSPAFIQFSGVSRVPPAEGRTGPRGHICSQPPILAELFVSPHFPRGITPSINSTELLQNSTKLQSEQSFNPRACPRQPADAKLKRFQPSAASFSLSKEQLLLLICFLQINKKFIKI